jgi:hypothetical protein
MKIKKILNAAVGVALLSATLLQAQIFFPRK